MSKLVNGGGGNGILFSVGAKENESWLGATVALKSVDRVSWKVIC